MRYFIYATLLTAILPSFALAQGPDLSRHPQFGPPKDPLSEPPPMVDPHNSPSPPSLLAPRENKIWKCSNCGAVIGQGPNEPKLEVCPKCGAKLSSWFNYWIIGGIGGSFLAALVIGSIVAKSIRKR